MSETLHQLREAQQSLRQTLANEGRYSPGAREAEQRLREVERERLAQPRAVYLPRPGTYAYQSIRPHSGVVGEEVEEERILVYYQDGGAGNIRNFADRVSHAAGALAIRAPTSAMSSYPAGWLARIGDYDPYRGEVRVEREAESLLAQWLGVERLEPTELLTTEGASQRRREMERYVRENPTMDPATRRFLEQEGRKIGFSIR